MSALAGRLLCDTYLSAREFVKEVSYTLSSLASSQLKMQVPTPTAPLLANQRCGRARQL
jgi:DNA polymerase alpha subunit A